MVLLVCNEVVSGDIKGVGRRANTSVDSVDEYL